MLVCILLIGVNLYVQSQGTHHRIQQELSQRLNTPLQLRQISLTPWSGLQLNGITIPQEGQLGGNFLKAQSFQLRVQFWSLFSDRLVIRQVSLVRAGSRLGAEFLGTMAPAGVAAEEKLPPARFASAAPLHPLSLQPAPCPAPPQGPRQRVSRLTNQSSPKRLRPSLPRKCSA